MLNALLETMLVSFITAKWQVRGVVASSSVFSSMLGNPLIAAATADNAHPILSLLYLSSSPVLLATQTLHLTNVLQAFGVVALGSLGGTAFPAISSIKVTTWLSASRTLFWQALAGAHLKEKRTKERSIVVLCAGQQRGRQRAGHYTGKLSLSLYLGLCAG